MTKNALYAPLAAFALLLPAASAQTVPIAAGRTSIVLNTNTLSVLSGLNLQVSAGGAGRLIGNTLAFPITVGAVDAATLKAEIFHAGALNIQLGGLIKGSTLTLANFTIDTTGAKPQLSALAVVNNSVLGRINVFDLNLPSGVTLPVTPAGNALIDLPQVGVSLSQDGSAALNKVFGITAFSAGIPIGTARVQALIDPEAIP